MTSRAGRIHLLVLLAVPAGLSGCLDVHDNAWVAHATQLDAVDAQTWSPVRIAILDTGVDIHHPALGHLTDGDRRNGEFVARHDFIGDDPDGDDVGHGTFVASLLQARNPGGLASVTDADARLAGLLPPIELMSGRVCLGEHCPIRRLDDALAWAIQGQADIIVLSLGFMADEVEANADAIAQVRSALASAERHGIVVVAAAGNDGRAGVLFPASEPTVLGVGALGRDLGVRSTSARGDGAKPDVAAPGEGIYGAWKDGGQVLLDGTSAAAPIAAAAAAVVVASDPLLGKLTLNASLVRQALRTTAQPVWDEAGNRDPSAGRGLVQAVAARQAYLRRIGT